MFYTTLLGMSSSAPLDMWNAGVLREGAWCTRGSPMRSVNEWVRMSDRLGRGRGSPGLTHEITIVRGQGRGGAYAEDRSIYVLI